MRKARALDRAALSYKIRKTYIIDKKHSLFLCKDRCYIVIEEEDNMLTTKRLFIEKFTPEEIPELMKIEHAPDNCKFTWTNTKEEHEEELNDPKVLTLAVKRREDGYIVGDVIVNLDIESEWFEIKRIAFREKGKGYGRETMNALIKYAFEEMKMNKVWLEAYTDNEVGRNLYDSLGFHIDGILRQHHKTERGILDQMQFSMLRDEYNKLKEKGTFQEEMR